MVIMVPGQKSEPTWQLYKVRQPSSLISSLYLTVLSVHYLQVCGQARSETEKLKEDQNNALILQACAKAMPSEPHHAYQMNNTNRNQFVFAANAAISFDPTPRDISARAWAAS